MTAFRLYANLANFILIGNSPAPITVTERIVGGMDRDLWLRAANAALAIGYSSHGALHRPTPLTRLFTLYHIRDANTGEQPGGDEWAPAG